jgi:GNAT superfamily N-acetyltransferase
VLPGLTIRRATPAAADYAALAELLPFADEGATADDLHAFDRACERSGAHSWRYLAQDHAGQTLGVGHFFPVTWLSDSGTYWLAMRVRPAYERRGIGSALFAQMEADLAALGGRAIWLMVPEQAPDLLAALERRGFRTEMRSHPYVLTVAEAPQLDLAQRMARLTTRGLRISTLAECCDDDPGWLEKVYALHAALTREVPIPEKIFTSRDEFAAFAVEAPTALLDAFWVVRDGDEYVGLSFMQPGAEPGILYQELTGTLPAYRGMGLAKMLKMLTITYAQCHGYASIITWVEDMNHGMVAINLDYGFVRQSGLVLLVRPVAPVVPLELAIIAGVRREA